MKPHLRHPAHSTLTTGLLLAILTPALLADWPQWRGPNRDGVSHDTTPIAEQIPDSGLRKVWESDTIPSDHYGGHGSPVIAGERVFMSLVWHERVPSETREIDTEVMQQLNHRSTSPELQKKLEEDRLSLSPRLRGDKLDEWIEAWLQANMTEKERIALGSWAASRFRAGRSALPLAELDIVSKRQNKPFENSAALQQWMEENQLSQPTRDKLMSAIPNTIKEAKDVIVCLDLNSGKELWRHEGEGLPVGRNASSTCAVIDGKVYSVASTHVYCVNAEDGTEIWKTPLTRKGPAASPLVADGKIIIAAGNALALDAATGTLIWEQKDAKGDTGSPQWWQPDSGSPQILFTGSNTLYGLNPETGVIIWKIKGGGQSTPVTSGDWLVFYSGAEDTGLSAAKYQPDAEPKIIWNNFWVTRRYSGSPIIHEGHVYLYCGEKHQCVELTTGREKWKETASSTITSPILADGKLLVLENNGSHLSITTQNPAAYHQHARVRIDAMGCTSPALSNGRLIVRQKNQLACFDLRPTE
jgi:outer membrane protein assembly factor BamB